MITKDELDALKEAATRASQDALDAQQAVSQAERVLQNLKLKLQATQARAANTNREYQNGARDYHIQQQSRRA